ncbi:MAG TPA: hypothetical protein VMP68_08910 [Candidatus Eisenbacteria bacterium]|nr:hypothetical protein [Candidatus Eisenbacteria bacterium]
MAKSTHASGESYTEHELADPVIRINRPNLGWVDQPRKEEEEWQPTQADGGDFSPSSKSEKSSSVSSIPSDQPLAPTTESLSEAVPEEAPDSTARTTDGSGQSAPKRRSSRAAKPAAPRVLSTSEFDEFE